MNEEAQFDPVTLVPRPIWHPIVPPDVIEYVVCYKTTDWRVDDIDLVINGKPTHVKKAWRVEPPSVILSYSPMVYG